MRLIVMFDLPVTTEKNRKVYTKFRNFLLDDGYYMLQYSVYARICKNSDDIQKHSSKIRMNIPPNGSVRLLQVTEKQFENMELLSGTATDEEKIGTDSLIVFE